MRRPFFLLPVVALGLAACAANGDPPAGAAKPDPAPAGQPAAPASIDSRDVAILVLEQAPSSLRVVSSTRRPRSSFGPAASWNGSGPPTHRWTLLGPNGEALTSGTISARSAVELPPDPRQGTPGANVPLASFAFDVKVPHPGPGEVIEIAPANGTGPVVRWP
jgi:hypothetical protein